MNNQGTRTADSRLALLVKAIDPEARLISHWPLTGGVSAQTIAIEFERACNLRERVVVRQHGPRDVARDPDIARHEFQLLQALHQSGIPVPRPLYVDHGDASTGGTFLVIELLDGEVITADQSAPSTEAIAEAAYWLARIHDFDLTTTDLSFLIPGDYQSVDRFEPRPDDPPVVQEICEALRQSEPAELRNAPVLLHGDYWRGNILWKDGRISGIIDWEDAFIGDPILDLARSRVEFHWTHGETTREQFTSQYLERRTINVDALAYWDLGMALGFARVLPEWGLPAEREREMMGTMNTFVQQAKERLKANWG